ncbi:hypothetical protein C8Q79DRAFT_611045 [Trametes meyenii]|nr:hypothetical protein C8Q79DRAFT_611045 [Trametes meyenii]
MTSAQPQSPAEFFIYSVRWDTSMTLSAFTILYYDYVMTFLSEIEYYWSPPTPSVSFLLFTFNRYIGLFGPIPVFFEYFSALSEHVSSSVHAVNFIRRAAADLFFFHLQRCRQLQLYHQIFAMLSQAVVAVLLILRTYALYNCNKRILALLIAMHLGGAVHCLSAVLTSKSPLTTISQARCTTSWSLLNPIHPNRGIHLALAWSAMLWFDSIIFALTLYKAIQMRRELSGGLLETLFRDGTIYYGILMAVNMVNIITFLETPPNTPMKGMATTMTNVLSVTLTSRLMLNLRDPTLQRSRRGGETSRYGGWSTGQFSSRMMSFRYGAAADAESMTLDEFGTSCDSDFDVRTRH